MSLSRSVTGKEFQRHGPATEKLLSPRRVPVLLVAHVKTSADRSDRRPMSVESWQSSARYCGSWPCTALYTRTASLKSVRCRTGNQCSSLRTGVICSRLPVFVCHQSPVDLESARVLVHMPPPSTSAIASTIRTGSKCSISDADATASEPSQRQVRRHRMPTTDRRNQLHFRAT